MHIRTLIFSSKPPLIRVNGKPRLIWRKHPTPKVRRLIPGRVHHVSTFAFVALPEAATQSLKPSERAALVDWFSKERIQVVMDHKGHHFNVTLRSTVLIARKDAPTEQKQAAGSPWAPTGKP
ncbi:hypothetical protein [Hydrogenophaga sp.]|uniref:hypothetical protein n=1 Tax=Hydrogenophaga sp. TaxID=1904254 RepID=UPI002AB8AAF7|nr:hypothetical protein [Hydrogenophaga sp.]MDZ4397036.1 hypothetical protein [Hydrogenophaga sp.]